MRKIESNIPLPDFQVLGKVVETFPLQKMDIGDSIRITSGPEKAMTRHLRQKYYYKIWEQRKKENLGGRWKLLYRPVEDKLELRLWKVE